VTGVVRHSHVSNAPAAALGAVATLAESWPGTIPLCTLETADAGRQAAYVTSFGAQVSLSCVSE
jgi:hypothetical protein